MGKIILEEMEFFAYHGCFEEEQIIGNRFVVNLELHTDTSVAEKTDNLEDTVNYQKVFNLIKEQMKIKSYMLENIARRILDSVHNEFRQISFLKVKVSKINPPMGGKMHCVSFELEESYR